MRRAQQFIWTGFMVALTACVGVSAEQKQQAVAHSKLGYAFMEEGLFQQAFVEYQKAQTANPRDKTVHYALGHLYFRQERWLDASREFETAVRLDPTYSDGHNYLGVAHQQMGRTEEAILHLRKALENPEWPTPHLAHHSLGLIMLAASRLDEAAEEFRYALRTQSNYLPAHIMLGEVYARQDRYDEAIKKYKETITLAPNYEDAHYSLGLAYLKVGDKPLAIAELKRVLELVPGSTLARKARQALDAVK